MEPQLGKNKYGYCFNSSQNLMGSSVGVNGFCFQKQEQFQIPQQKMYRNCFDTKNGELIAIPHDVPEREIERLIIYQNERLKLVMQEQMRKQMESILRNAEAKVEILMKQKDHEISKAISRKLELEKFLNRTEIECRKWQNVATENESMVESLKNTIEQYKEINFFMNQVDDSESCCDIPYKDNKGGENICKFCNIRKSRVVWLPCKHLCCCKLCERFIGTCPICGIVKKASIEVIF